MLFKGTTLPSLPYNVLEEPRVSSVNSHETEVLHGCR